MTHPLLRDPLRWCASASLLLAAVLVAEWYYEATFGSFLRGVVAAVIFGAATAGATWWRARNS